MVHIRFLRATAAQLQALTVDPGRIILEVENKLLYIGAHDASAWLQVGTKTTDVQAAIDAALAPLGIADVLGLVDALSTKVSASDLAAINASLGNYANQSDLTALTTTVGTKVSQADIDASVASKANQSDLSALATTVGTKQDAAALTTALQTKAAKSLLDSLTTTVGTKQSTSDLNTSLALKADKTVTDGLRTDTDTKALQTNVAALTTTVSNKVGTATFTSAAALKVSSADLFDGGLIKSALLPSSVDDVVEFISLTSFPTTGEKGKIYVADDTNLIYRWSGSAFTQIASPVIQRLATTAEAQGLTDSVDPLSPLKLGVIINMVGLAIDDNGKWTANEGVLSTTVVKGYAKLNTGPSARIAPSLTAIGQFLYLFGGASANAALNDLWIYDIAHNTWAAGPTPPAGLAARSTHVAVAAGGMLYIIGGWNGSANLADVWQYNPTTKAWTQKTSMTTAMSGHAGFKGTYNSEDVVFIKGNDGTYRRYVPSTDTWTTLKTGLSTEVAMGINLGSDGTVYSYGGQASSAALGTEYSYVLATGVQSAITPPLNNPGPKYYPNLVTGGSKMYLRGSGPLVGSVTNDLWEFTPATKAWRRLRGGGPEVTRGALEYANGMLYAFGGFLSDGTRTNEFWRIDVSMADQAGFGRPAVASAAPVTISNFGAAIGGGYIHMYGGALGNSTYGNLYRWYNLSTKAWGVSSAIATATWAGGVFAGGYFWAAQGHDGTYNNNLFRFTPATSTFTKFTNVPGAARTQGRLVSVSSTTLNLMGGYLGAAAKNTNLHYQYNITTNTWTQKANMPYAANGHAVGTYNGKIYLAGGYSNDNNANRNDFYEYDPATDKWTALTPMPDVAVWVGGSVIGNYFVVGAAVGGYLVLYIYNFTTKVWSTMNTNLTNRWTVEFLADTNGMWLVGGCTVSPGASNFETAARLSDMVFLTLQ